ncbi:MAG: phenylalanine--tRNA ligase subunit alpha [[Lactobacillus] timonensis]|jgi:phenylalanyl-tRNA synthetase alpha chain|uniref:phenylalanine--tRNA ligase subunit alpha n=1 Tax=[Lactobacillus] timonensis TaxID=1970790 RepID=UPI0023543359|nr:phenylalanine--tRNA ligase subunit alpha [[Lactobacillus] timonensis]MCI1925669.1 phenylalanine--tRNA ligase subunit alpha [[Lactobacillus] timonensis]MCI1957030.1 phenylalanine--tRNA ligase subunit alpha [[Lactobacillus] timonensis]MCI1970015.1 phenylalanine--tRNA ligase subunit alpha [[Lactobacillus] timonensis]MCI2006220.1 phenylalanine--tRNA ligase subunit alpha [[Lactobacillus] timonensis]
MGMKEKLAELRQQGLEAIEQSQDLDKINQARVKWLGKKGPLTQILRGMGKLSPEERPAVGKYANDVRNDLQEALQRRKQEMEKELLNAKLMAETVDVTLPGAPVAQGQPHVIQQIIDQLIDLFIGMGYEVATGPEVEEEVYNFEKLNLPKDHPARDMQDTFYITPQILMRTQTSPMQARMMEKHDFSKGPLKMISPGKVYRRDTDDATHSHQFHQLEGLVVGEHVTMADLRGTLQEVGRNLFGDQLNVRLRPSYFPFTEPSVEADVTCFNCLGKGCDICKGTGWIECLGAGMVHPNVLKMSGVDSEKYSGFAFGLGPDRFAMLKYGVTDIRDFYLNDMRFLTQFDEKG